MIHVALPGSTIEALAMCANRVVATIAIPEDSDVSAVPNASMLEVSWLCLRFADGSELELWPETIATPMKGWSFALESFVLHGEHRAPVTMAARIQHSRTTHSFVEPAELQSIVSGRQVLGVKIRSDVEIVDNQTFRVDSAIQMTLDENIIELVTQHQRVMPMRIGIQTITPHSSMRSNPAVQGTLRDEAAPRP